MSFPVSPSNGDTYTTGGKTYIYNSTKGTWSVINAGNVAVPTVINTTGGQTINGSLTTTGNLLTDSKIFTGTTSYIDAWNTNQNIIIAGTGTPGVTIAQASNATTPSVIAFAKSRGTTPGDWTTPVQSGDNIGTLNFTGADGLTRISAGRIQTSVDGSVSSGVVPGRITFSTANSAGNLVERVRVNSEGNVGIANTAPTHTLSVTGTMNISGNANVGNLGVSGTINDSIGNVRDVPQNPQTGAYVLVASDNGKHISITTGGVTVPNSVFVSGDTVTIYNNSSSSQTITQGASVTMYLVGTATTGNRTLAQRGLATVLCVAANTFVITGGGLT